jgi:ATP-dependent RNA helicase RhlE
MSFKDYQFHPQINTGIASCGYTTPTPIQKEAIPSVLTGRNILGLAQTGRREQR